MSDHDLPADLVDLLGIPTVSAAEQTAVLDLTRVVAHSTERRFGPLAIYALGLAMGAATDPAERARRLQDAIAAVDAHEATG